MAVKQPQYSPHQVAKALGVSESSVKRWCDRDAIPTIRTLGGHRRITLDGLQVFLRGGARKLVNPEALGLPSLASCRATQLPGSDQPAQKAFRHMLASGNEPQCRRLLREQIEEGRTAFDAVEFLITDSMIGLGEAWQCNDIDVYQERRACEICLRLIAALRSELPTPSRTAPIAIGGAPEGDPYQLPTAMAELALHELGWNATNLGNNLPLDSFLQAAHDYRPRLVWMSVSTIENQESFIAGQIELARLLGGDIALFVGGRALTDEIRPRLRYTAFCDSLSHFVELAAMTQIRISH